ncbi:uncharacterized protein A4U43_C01F14070 [Asparagus officinalis]|uniref:GDSL esterase/lipase n=1 Tax=Asparagus officinalis TaxID=4686 RepID=A0A5P1FPF8_ASPOF|nr:uncharacterized protein A4U43_C01F14070 [Asparagus officinalis]
MKIPKTPLLALLSLIPLTLSELQEAEVNGMFVFGSSLVDNGNNNFLKNATTKANFHPYGVDFPLGPSGRFSNGRNAIDVLGGLLKLPRLIPPFTDPRTRGARVVHGVNFASGGSGILDQTGSFRGEVMSLSQQIRDFKVTTLPQLRTQLRCVHSPRLFEDHLSNYLFVVGTGGNDYLQYFVSKEKDKVTVPVFTESLISTLSRQLKDSPTRANLAVKCQHPQKVETVSSARETGARARIVEDTCTSMAFIRRKP